MKKVYKKLFSILAVVTLIFTACTPDDHNLGSPDVTSDELVEGIAYTITHDTENPNIVYLESKMDSRYTPLWNHPQGRSQEKKVTLRIPFEGTYEVTFGVETRGGVIYGAPATFTIDDFHANFVDNELWTLLSGGVGNSKKWLLDIDADGQSRLFNGPVFFYGTDDSWESVTDGKTVEGDSWSWTADFGSVSGWQFSATPMDFGYMEFDLKNGSNVHVVMNELDKDMNGSYMLDVDNHTITFSNAELLHDAVNDPQVGTWTGMLKLLSLTEDGMQIGVIRTADPCMLSFNFISEDYYNNWTPGDQPEPEPTLPEGWQDDISQTVTTAIKWVLSPETPFNWAGLDGTFLNEGWESPETYPDWTGFDASIPATYADFSLTMDSKDKSILYIAPDGTQQTGSYELDDKGIYTFNGVNPSFNICSWINLSTSADKTWRITQIEKDGSGNITGMWVGVRDVEKPEYMVYHLIPQAGSN